MSTREAFRAAVTAVAERARAKLPQETNGRVEAAAKLVLLDEVHVQADGSIQVGSCTDPTKVYHLVGTTCDCQDFPRAPESWCKHRIAAGIQKRVRELLPQAIESAPGVDTECTPAPAPLPEAPASVNVRLTIGGREVQLTLRDTDEARVLVRLEEVLQRFPQPQAPAQADHAYPGKRETPAPEAGGLPQCPHGHGFLRKSTKREGYYCPHKWDDGSYCKGR